MSKRLGSWLRTVSPSHLGSLGRLAITVAAVALSAGTFAAAASAHAFLIRSSPQAGARLATAPNMMSLGFSEPLIAGSQRVVIVRANGHTVELPRSSAAGLTVDQPLPHKLSGVFVVSWRVVSIDGHVSLGQFAFGAGSAGVLPKVATASQPTSWPAVAASWLMFLGLALALGGLLSERFVWSGAREQTLAGAPVLPGVIIATVGAVLQLVLLAANEHGSGLTTGLTSGALGNAIGTRPGELTLAILIALLAAGALACVRPLHVYAIVPLMTMVVFSAALGHSGTLGTAWPVVADSVHLAAVAAWVGALAGLVLLAARAEQPRLAFAVGAGRYSRFALPTVVVILITGVLTAIPEFGTLDQVVSTGYGRTLVIKSGLVLVALLFALTARLRALSANPQPRVALFRRLTRVEAAAVLGVLVAAALLVNAAPPHVPAAQASTSLLGPPPVAGPNLRVADLAGQLVVGLTAGGHQLQFAVFAPAYQAPGRLSLSARADLPDGASRDLFPRRCGTGCFTIDLPLEPGLTRVTARASSSKWKGGDVQFAIPWPLRGEDRRIIGRVIHTMRALRSTTFTQTTTLPYGSPEPPTIRSLSGARFLEIDSLGAPATDVRFLGAQNGLREFAYIYTRGGSDIWYRIWVDRTDRVRREIIVAEQGRISRTFSHFH